MNPSSSPPSSTIGRATASIGSSGDAIYRMVTRTLAKRRPGGGGTLLDVGCGKGELRKHILAQVEEYIGADVLRYKELPDKTSFLQIDLDAGRVPLPDGSAEVVAAVETIEHLENPRAFFRELVRLTTPGGWVIVTTPNQLSILSKLTLLTKNQFNAFQEGPGLYPAHITALLECDLRRISQECGLQGVEIYYSEHGRMPFTAKSWPPQLRHWGRLFSDNVLCIAQKPKEAICP